MKGLVSKFYKSKIVRNSLWGIVGNISQTIFVSLFFIIIARKYTTGDFSRFLIALTIYQLVTAFSSMGLGKWFVREFDEIGDKKEFTGKFIKTQIGLGLLFYGISAIATFFIYPGYQIRILFVILGINIVFDNIIAALTNLNVAEFKQKKTFIILFIDSFLKLVSGCLLFIYPFSIVYLALFLITIRFLTVNLFIRVGSSDNISFFTLWYAKVNWPDIKREIFSNWRFIVIGSVSIIYWRFANIIISKLLLLKDVADYEISFRIFSILMILPTIASTTVYPRFIQLYNSGNISKLKQLYKNLFFIYNIFAISSYAFIYSFADVIIPYAFSNKYDGAIMCLQQMVLTILIFPSAILQANLIVAMRAEKVDMNLNILSLLVNVTCSIVGLYFYKSLSIVNYSIFISFLIFHISQNVFLIRKNISSLTNSLFFYAVIGIFILSYQLSSAVYNYYVTFGAFCFILIVLLFILIRQSKIFDTGISINNI